MHNNTTSRPGAQGLPKAGSSASLPELHKKSVLSKASLRSFWSKLFFCAIWPGRAGLCVLYWCVLSLPRASLPASCWGRLASGRGVASRSLVLAGGLVGLAPRRSRPLVPRAGRLGLLRSRLPRRSALRLAACARCARCARSGRLKRTRGRGAMSIHGSLAAHLSGHPALQEDIRHRIHHRYRRIPMVKRAPNLVDVTILA